MTTDRSPLEWDAATYDRVSSPQLDWGLAVLDRLELRGDETVLDAGCGTGRVTAELVKRVPRGRVIAVDGSPAMAERARAALGPRVEVRVADLRELSVPEPVDVVFSTATFHWIPDHELLFERLHAALRPGGRLEAQCGGQGNVANVVEALTGLSREAPWARHLERVPIPWYFASPAQGERDLRRAGFVEARGWLERRDAAPPDMRAFVASSIAVVHLDALPEAQREPFLDALMARLGNPSSLPYVRLNLSARRAGQAASTPSTASR
jgi:trans-aconitate 2-methyltransferase